MNLIHLMKKCKEQLCKNIEKDFHNMQTQMDFDKVSTQEIIKFLPNTN